MMARRPRPALIDEAAPVYEAGIEEVAEGTVPLVVRLTVGTWLAVAMGATGEALTEETALEMTEATEEEAIMDALESAEEETAPETEAAPAAEAAPARLGQI